MASAHDVRFELRLTKKQAARWLAEAKRYDITLSELVRRFMDTAIQFQREQRAQLKEAKR